MKSIFPNTPQMRYERAALALAMAAVCFFLALHFGALSQQLSASFPNTLSLQLALVALPAAAFSLTAIAFILFAVIKFATNFDSRHLHWFVRARSLGINLVWAACALGGLWIAANVALRWFM